VGLDPVAPVPVHHSVTAGTGVEPAYVQGVDVDAVATAVSGCAGVSALFAGRFHEVGTYLPGRRVAGIEVDPSTVTVHVRSRWGVTAARLREEVSLATTGLLAAHSLHLVIADIDDPPSTSDQQPLRQAQLSSHQEGQHQ
jgi:hypothetical protein